jgi:polyphosphate kinase
VDELFPGMEVTGCYQFRVTRNSDLFVDTEEVDDLLRALEGELPGRRYGDEVRLEVADNCPGRLEAYLVKRFGLTERDVYRCQRPGQSDAPDRRAAGLVDRPTSSSPASRPACPSVCRRPTTSSRPSATATSCCTTRSSPSRRSSTSCARRRPTRSVLAIKQTLYRTGTESVVVDALTAAAAPARKSLVVVELRARFDEEANISLASPAGRPAPRWCTGWWATRPTPR